MREKTRHTDGTQKAWGLSSLRGQLVLSPVLWRVAVPASRPCGTVTAKWAAPSQSPTKE